AIVDFTDASPSALRATMITLQPSAAKTAAVAAPMPFEAPVIKAGFPASFRSMMSPRENGPAETMERPRGPHNRAVALPAPRFDHAANALAMADFCSESEVSRGGIEIERATPDRGFRPVDLERHRLAGGRACCRNVFLCHAFRVCDEIAELLAPG